MDYEVKQLDELILVSSSGKAREDALENLKAYLSEIGMEAKKFYYLEAYNSKGVAGAVAFASVDVLPERNRKFPAEKVSQRNYFIFDYPYDEFVERMKPGSDNKLDLKSVLKEEGYKMSGFLPFFEFLPETEVSTIRVYIPVE